MTDSVVFDVLNRRYKHGSEEEESAHDDSVWSMHNAMGIQGDGTDIFGRPILDVALDAGCAYVFPVVVSPTDAEPYTAAAKLLLQEGAETPYQIVQVFDIPLYPNPYLEPFYYPVLAQVEPNNDQVQVESIYDPGSHDLALPLSILWTGI
ncbi:hypothetical protein ACFL6U_18950 [Planctomycetota bacterium]